jgi:hypothetical protein
MAHYFPLILTGCSAAITVAGWPLASRIERAVISATTALAIIVSITVYL